VSEVFLSFWAHRCKWLGNR